MAAKEKELPRPENKMAAKQVPTEQQEARSAVIRARPAMVARAAVAVTACVAALLALYLTIHLHESRSYFYWGLAAAESAFFVYYHCSHVPYFTNLAHREGPQEHDATFIKQRLLEQLLRVDDIMACMASWFLEAGPGDVKKENLKELFAYAIWYKSLGEMEAEGLMPELDDLMAQLERSYGRRLPPGYNPNLRFMSHLWEPLRHMYRPLLVYGVMELLALLCHVALLATGFRLRQLDGITYYTLRVGPQKLVPAISASMKRCRSSLSVSSAATCGIGSAIGGSSSSPATLLAAGSASCGGSAADLSNTPIVFLHGVGAGLLPYLTLIFRLAALGRPMILPHSKHVSMRLVSWIPTVDDMADATAAMLSAHGFSAAAVMAHSYGTMVASRLVMKYPQLVHSMCLTDPVCFAMFMPNLLRNFLYAHHNSGCWVMDRLLRFVASELHCCANFSRKFFWSSINLWDEHIPERTLVVLGGKDILSPAEQVDRWLREHTHAQVMYEPSMRHAGMLLSMPWQDAIVSAFVDMMQRPDLAGDQQQKHNSTAGATAPASAAAGGVHPVGAAAALTRPESTAADAAADATATITAVAASEEACAKACGRAAATLRQRSSSRSGDTVEGLKPAGSFGAKASGAAAAAAAVAAVGECAPLKQQQHSCGHQHQRVCSDCLVGCQLGQGCAQQLQQDHPALQVASPGGQQQQLGPPCTAPGLAEVPSAPTAATGVAGQAALQVAA